MISKRQVDGVVFKGGYFLEYGLVFILLERAA